VTGELAPDERQAQIEALADASQNQVPVLVATDCLSEGVNLQNLFSAVVHYDLSWNPTRHEQREGRVDRFGQPAPAVRALTLYGENNPVDGAVLNVILRKAERIRKELGVPVPIPQDTNRVTEAIMQAVLLKTGGIGSAAGQGRLDFGSMDRELDLAWESAKEKARQTQTIFAQRRLRPDDVLPEWGKAVSVLGGEADVERFIRIAAERLGAPLEQVRGGFRLPARHLPPALGEKLEGVGLRGPVLRIGFHHPVPTGFEYIHRTHALVSALADYVAEAALANNDPDLAARCGAVATKDINERTTVLLLRLRCQIGVELRDGARFIRQSTLLAEECVGVSVQGAGTPVVLAETDALALMATEPYRNMDRDERAFEVAESVDALPALQLAFEAIAQRRAGQLLADHTRVREASAAKVSGTRLSPACPSM
jgi:hypothetical protein